MNVSNAGTAGAGEVWSGASAPMSPSQKMSNLFDAMDPTGSGSINQAQFQQAFQTMNPPASFQAAGSNSVWNELDSNGTGSVSKPEFVSTMTTLMKQLRGHHHGQSSAGAASLTAGIAALGGASQTSNESGAVGSLLDLLA